MLAANSVKGSANLLQEITSPQNARIKRAVKLRERRHRRQQGRTIVDGLREATHAIASAWKVDELFCQRSTLESEPVQALVRDACEQGAFVGVVDDKVFAKLAFGERCESVAATLHTPMLDLDQLTVAKPNCLICVLDRIEKPGNIGAVLRTLDAIAADALILSDPVADVFNPNALRASLGAVFRIPIAAANEDAVKAWLDAREIATFAARVEGAVPYDREDYRGAAAFVFGSEAHGLADHWPTAKAIAIPMLGELDSLNVSVSAAVIMYEAIRQRSSA